MHHAVRLESRLGDVEDDQVAHARQLVVAAHNGGELGRLAGKGLGVKHRGRPVGIAAVKFHLFGAVGIHLKQDARERVR